MSPHGIGGAPYAPFAASRPAPAGAEGEEVPAASGVPDDLIQAEQAVADGEALGDTVPAGETVVVAPEAEAAEPGLSSRSHPGGLPAHSLRYPRLPLKRRMFLC